MRSIFPETNWTRAEPAQVGFSADGLAEVGAWLEDTAAGRDYRVLVVRDGRLVAEWNAGIPAEVLVVMHSASKSAYTMLLGIAVDEGVLPSLDTPLIDVYPEFMEVGPGEGPKPGRHAYPPNRAITFRHLVGNTSGYLKPDEIPGHVFHYQTFGMKVFSNAIATAYGLYDSSDPDRLPGCARLVEEKIRAPIGGTWQHRYYDFDYSDCSSAKKNIFGHGMHLLATAHDAARLGHLWVNRGNWGGRQVVPADYLAEATRTNAEIMRNGTPADRKYGLGFWVNDHAQLWPDLPRDIFGAWGGRAKYVWASPARDIVLAMVPAPWDDVAVEADRRVLESAFIARVLAAAEG